MKQEWYKLSINEIFKILNTSENGLSKKEILERIKKYGYNELPKKKQKTFFQIFFSELKDSIVILLIIMSMFSFLIGEYVDGSAIIFIILVDLIMGTLQELKANKNASEITNLIKDLAIVRRNGKEIEIESKELVRGDIIFLESGNRVSADLRVISSNNFFVNESILTGESTEILKENISITDDTILSDRKNMVFAGTSVVSGRAICVVVETGLNTEVGKIATSINEIKETKSPLTIRIEKFSKQISIIIIIVAIIISVIFVLKGYNLTEIFLSVVALSVSAMPEGLPLALTMALTIASNKMSHKNVIVKKLKAAESLGSCTVIATDKTGTLTLNEQMASKIVLPNGYSYDVSGDGYKINGKVTSKYDLSLINDLIFFGDINNDAVIDDEKCIGDSIDIAFKILAKKYYLKRDEYEILNSIPYESENKYSACFYKKNEKVYCTIKGSIETVLEYCKYMRVGNEVINIDKELLLNQNLDLANQGFRVIAIAGNTQKHIDYIDDLIFEGMVAFIDPIRPDVKSAINSCKQAKIKVVMITGDHPLTAFNIANTLGIAKTKEEVATSKDLEKYELLGQKDYDEFISKTLVFSRVTPMDKLKIVESLKRNKEFVAVTGDGVNDAPALASASIGVAMGSGTDVAKETASMIIVDDNFSSIVEGIKEGRTAYSNIRKVCYMLISCGFAEVLFFLLSIIFNMPMPLVAVQLLWLNIVTDGLQDFSLSFEKSEKNIMKQKPRKTTDSIFDKELFTEIIISGLFMGILVFGLWYYLINILNIETVVARGYVMAEMVFIQNIHVLNCRSEIYSTFKISIKSNLLIILTIISSILLQIIVMNVDIFSKFLQVQPISFSSFIMLFLLSLLILIVMEIFKYIKRLKLTN